MGAALAAAIEAALPTDLPGRIGVAVSGGSDSLALLLLMRTLAKQQGLVIEAATVDHGLRAEAAAEAAQVAALCADKAIAHQTLRWEGWDGTGNTQDAARQARYGLLTSWAQARDLGAVALGHTLDDQAETVVMRLARGAGVDGLSAMAAVRHRDGLLWLRPLLEVRRETLRDYLRTKGIRWADDPSNADPAYERVRVRRLLEHLGEVDISPEKLADVARNMRAARDALDSQMRAAARRIAVPRAGALDIDWAAFQRLPEEIARRLTLAALRWLAGDAYAPRARSVAAALLAVRETGSATLDGCRFLLRKDRLWMMRELKAIEDLRAPPEALWDGRWAFSGQGAPAGAYLAAVGESGIRQCPDWRATGVPRPAVLVSPGLWLGDRLLAAPCAGHAAGWQADVKNSETPFGNGQ